MVLPGLSERKDNENAVPFGNPIRSVVAGPYMCLLLMDDPG
jgi:hypothetical protein